MDGDDFVRQLAAFLRRNGPRLADATFGRPKRQAGWLSHPEPLRLTTDTHRLFYLLMRFDALSLPTGPLDVLVHAPSRPLVFLQHSNPVETSSLASFRSSLSAVSRLSWWSAPPPSPSPDDDVRFVFSTFTKLPALSINAPGSQPIIQLSNDPPINNAIPLDVFKNLQVLECHNIDPRVLLAWDFLAQSLRSLKISQSGIDDISFVFVHAVLDDAQRRQDPSARSRPRSLSSAVVAPLSPPTPLPPFSWSFLRHLYLQNNQLTFLPNEIMHHLSSITHLDLSSNLFVSAPPALALLPRLQSLNLSDNLIDSVVGIYLNLGQIVYLNLAHNRLESLCGLERLLALEHVDIRFNLLDESAEVARLTDLPHISRLSVQGNPFVDIEPDYRVSLFNRFRQVGLDVSLDGTPPGYYESFRLVPLAPIHHLPNQSSMNNKAPVVVSPVPHHQRHASEATILESPAPPTSTLLPLPGNTVGSASRPRKRKATRIVRLDASAKQGGAVALDAVALQGSDTGHPFVEGPVPQGSRDTGSGHSRHHTEHIERKPCVSDDALPPARSSRHQRVSASVFEPGSTGGLDGGDVEEYRKRIEGLQRDVGDGWLKIFSQSESQKVT